MSILIKMVKPKAILANGRKLKKIMANGQQIWSGAVRITFVEGSTRTTVEYEDGTTVNRATAPSGASFVGWSTSSDGSSPQRTFKATQDMTVYRVVKYNDITGSMTSNSYVYLPAPSRYSRIHFTMPELHNAVIAWCSTAPPTNIGIGDILNTYGAVTLASGSLYNYYCNNPYQPGYYLFWTNPYYTFTRTYAITGKQMVG